MTITLQEPARIYDFAYFFDQDESENESIKIKGKEKIIWYDRDCINIWLFLRKFKGQQVESEVSIWSLASVSFFM